MLVANNVLFMTWQPREAAMYFPIGRLVERPESPRYEFAYLRGAKEARLHGFGALRDLPDLDRVYTSAELHPLFKNRLMPESRPDFQEYVHRIGLDARVARPIEILGRGAGQSATDRVELFSPPTFDAAKDSWSYVFPARGLPFFRFAEERVTELVPGDALYCMTDIQNEQDPHAVALRTEDHVLVGYVPRYMSEDVDKLLRRQARMRVRVLRVNPAPFPAQLRLFCVWEVEAVEGFSPFSTDEYQPIAVDATQLEWNTRRRAS